VTFAHLILAAGTSGKAVSSGGSSAWVTPTIVIAVVSLAVSLWTFFLTGRRSRVDRQRQVFADAMDAVMTYREYPFIVFRRNADDLASERRRISADLSELQAKLNGFRGRLKVEDRYVGERFAELLGATRRIAGPMIAEAWNGEPASADENVHNPGFDLTPLNVYDQLYLQAVADHLGLLWAPLRRRLHKRSGKKRQYAA